MRTILHLTLSALLFLAPLLWRLIDHGVTQPAGLLSDAATGCTVWFIYLLLPRWLRPLPLLCWVLFQIAALELFAAMHRFPSWQDLHYLIDPLFLKNSTAGFSLAAPLREAVLAVLALLLLVVPALRARQLLAAGLLLPIALSFMFHARLSKLDAASGMAARYNALHWFSNDAISSLFAPPPSRLSVADLPKGLRSLDLEGASLLENGKGRAKNVLIVVMEGIPGLYHPEIRRALGITSPAFVMQGLVENTGNAMLIPHMVTHSAQTIRGLYAILCGDFSKLSMKTPKAFEIEAGSEAAANCLPARMAAHGWSTHYLQGAGLTFMSKDRVMPKIGFQHVHGAEWFTEPDPYPFEWGVSDPAFFKGARRYIAELRQNKQPWMLTLLTVGTHHPYASASPEVSHAHPDRVEAAVVMLDQAVAAFLKGLAEDGVPEDTLIILTCDESHGSHLADWMASWGMGIVMAPEQQRLPRLKDGEFGLVDITASVLDYCGIPAPSTIIGRSFFRDYATPREMVAYTATKLRWHSADNLLYECAPDSDTCVMAKADSIIGQPAAPFQPDLSHKASYFFERAAVLDNKLIAGAAVREMRFANGEIRKLPQKTVNEWSENLVGAQYLDFPAGTTVHVSMRIRAVQADSNGLQLKLNLRAYEHLQGDISYPSFPVLHQGETTTLAFDFNNPKPRQAFSFHLFGEGNNAAVSIEEFTVTVRKQDN